MSSIEAIRRRLEHLFDGIAQTPPRSGTLPSEMLGRPDMGTPQGWIWELDSQGYFSWCSPEVERVLGIPPGQLIGQPLSAIGLDQESAEKVAEAIRSQAPLPHLMARATNRDGKALRLFIRALPKMDTQGRLDGYRGVAQVQETGRAPTGRLAIALPLPPDRLDAFASPDLAPSWGEILGFEDDGESVHPLSPSQAPETGPLPDSERLVVPLRGQDAVLGTIELEGKDGGPWTEEDRALAEALAHEFALALQDARSHQLTQQALEEMREADRLKSQFLANMSHELRTPLNSIIGFSKVILKGIDGPVTEKQREDLTAIYNAGQHLLGLINDILDLSKIEAGKMELAFSEVDLREIIQGVMSTAAGLVKDRPIELITDVPDDLPRVQADNIRIRQVLLNLISNAAKFTEEGHIGISARTIRRAGQEEIVVAVFDTGPGIKPEDQERIFEPFSQVDASPTRKTGGTGLGLSICRHLVELHGGVIWVESVPGEGSTFAFTLPLQHEGAQAEDLATLVLGVTSRQAFSDTLGSALESAGYRYHALTRPEHLADAAHALSPQIVVLDLSLPAEAILRSVAELRGDPALAPTRVVLSAFNPHEAWGAYLPLEDLLPLAWKPDALWERISQAIPSARQSGRILLADPLGQATKVFEEIPPYAAALELTSVGDYSEASKLLENHSPDGILILLSTETEDRQTALSKLLQDIREADLPAIGILPEKNHRIELGSDAMLKPLGMHAEQFIRGLVSFIARAS